MDKKKIAALGWCLEAQEAILDTNYSQDFTRDQLAQFFAADRYVLRIHNTIIQSLLGDLLNGQRDQTRAEGDQEKTGGIRE